MNSSIEMPILGGMPIDTALKTWAEANAHPMSARPLDDPCAGLPGKARKKKLRYNRMVEILLCTLFYLLCQWY